MIGAVAGDLLGSVYEAWPTKDKGFRLFHELGKPTDDSVLSVAVAEAIHGSEGPPGKASYGKALREHGRRYPDAGYGGSFRAWMKDGRRGPYRGWSNGSAMRASAVGWAFGTEDEVLRQAALSASPTHDHPEGIAGAQAIALAVFLARTGAGKAGMKAAIESRFGYDLGRSVECIRPAYRFDLSCRGSVPESIVAFLDSSDWEDAVRNAISLGGDADTMGCMAGAIAEAFYGGVPPRVLAWTLPRIEDGLLATLAGFAEAWLPPETAEALAAELEARAWPRGFEPGRKSPARAKHRVTYRLTPAFRAVLDGEAWKGLQWFATRFRSDRGVAGSLLRDLIGREPLAIVDANSILFALLETAVPRLLAGGTARGDGTDVTTEELALLGQIGMALPVTAFRGAGRDGHAREPVAATLLLAPGTFSFPWRSDDGCGPPSGHRLLPLLRYASASALANGRRALVILPEAARLDDLAAILELHAGALPGIRALWLPQDGTLPAGRMEYGGIGLIVGPPDAHPLMSPAESGGPGDDLPGCGLFVVASPGDAGFTDTLAVTDAMFLLSGFRGRRDPDRGDYLPPAGVPSWASLVAEHPSRMRTGDVVVIGDPPV